MWDLQGNLHYKWSGDTFRVHDLALSPDGTRLVVLLETRILIYDFGSYEKVHEYKVGKDTKLTSVCISQDSNFMLISMNQNKIALMDIETLVEVEVYEGHLQSDYIIRSVFGGASQNFVVSGSEGKHPTGPAASLFDEPLDSNIYIWRINGTRIETLAGHSSGCVNAVAWHPKDPRVFASAGDDHKVRIWRPASSSGSTSTLSHPNR